MAGRLRWRALCASVAIKGREEPFLVDLGPSVNHYISFSMASAFGMLGRIGVSTGRVNSGHRRQPAGASEADPVRVDRAAGRKASSLLCSSRH